MNFFSRLFSWPTKKSIRDLEKEIEKNDEAIAAEQPIVEEAARRTKDSAEDLRVVVRKSKRRTEVGRRLVEDIAAGIPHRRSG
jgi:hypothetical protein